VIVRVAARVAAALVVVLVLSPLPAGADEQLADRLDDQATADFEASGIVMCSWGRDSAAGAYSVARQGSMSMTSSAEGDLMITDALAMMRRGGDWYAVDFTNRTAWSLSERYRLGEPEAIERLGRSARRYVVFEGVQPRLRIVVDDVTAVPLLTEVLDGEGRVFRVAALMEVTASDQSSDMPSEVRHRTVAVVEAGPQLPASVAGYRRVDTYAVEGGGIQGYYSDGLFSFSVFQTGRGDPPAAFDGATRFTVAGRTYLRVVTPTVVWVYWGAPDFSYMLVGDLPPDHLAAALEELPYPGERALLVRMWRRLFG
jgi:hypothetical protein